MKTTNGSDKISQNEYKFDFILEMKSSQFHILIDLQINLQLSHLQTLTSMTASKVYAATDAMYETIKKFAEDCPMFGCHHKAVVPDGGEELGEHPGAPVLGEYLQEFFGDGDNAYEDWSFLKEIHLADFKLCDFEMEVGEHDLEAQKITAVARKPLAVIMKFLQDEWILGLGGLPCAHSFDDCGISQNGKPTGPVKAYYVGLYRLLAITYRINYPHVDFYDDCNQTAEVCVLTAKSCKNPDFHEQFMKKESKRKRVKVCKPLPKPVEKHDLDMSMIRDFLSNANLEDCQEISRMLMERQKEINEKADTEPFECDRELAEVEDFQCPDGWSEVEYKHHKMEGVGTIWECEETDEVVFPCADISKAKLYEYNADCDAINPKV